MEHGLKSYNHSHSAAKNRDAANLTHHFHWGSPSSQSSTTPKFKLFGNNFYMN